MPVAIEGVDRLHRRESCGVDNPRDRPEQVPEEACHLNRARDHVATCPAEAARALVEDGVAGGVGLDCEVLAQLFVVVEVYAAVSRNLVRHQCRIEGLDHGPHVEARPLRRGWTILRPLHCRKNKPHNLVARAAVGAFGAWLKPEGWAVTLLRNPLDEVEG